MEKNSSDSDATKENLLNSPTVVYQSKQSPFTRLALRLKIHKLSAITIQKKKKKNIKHIENKLTRK